MVEQDKSGQILRAFVFFKSFLLILFILCSLFVCSFLFFGKSVSEHMIKHVKLEKKNYCVMRKKIKVTKSSLKEAEVFLLLHLPVKSYKNFFAADSSLAAVGRSRGLGKL